MRTSLHAIPALLTLSHAFKSISIPSTVAANKSTTVTIVNDISSGASSFDAQFDLFRVYLAIITPNPSLSYQPPSKPSCYLVNSTSINTTTLDIQIPALIGPSENAYSIVTLEYSTDPNGPVPSGFEFSDQFALVNGTGEWTKADLAQVFPLFPDYLPCAAYPCARQCIQKGYPGNVNGTSTSGNATGEAAFQTTYECMGACPGVTYPNWTTVAREGVVAVNSVAEEGNQGANTIIPGYAASLLTSNTGLTLPTITASANSTTVAPSTTAFTTSTPSATGKSGAGRREIGEMAMFGGLVAGVGVLGGLL